MDLGDFSLLKDAVRDSASNRTNVEPKDEFGRTTVWILVAHSLDGVS